MAQPKLKQTKAKTKRRGNNEGTIYQRADGRWCGMVVMGYKTNGYPIRKTVYGTSRQEVAKKITPLTDEVFNNGYITESVQQERNFEKLCSEWFDLFVAGTTTSPTEERRRTLLRNHIYPVFGALDVQTIDLVKLQKFFRSKSREGYSLDYTRKMKNLLNNFFKYLTKQKIVQENPVTDVVLCKSETDNDEDNKGKALRPEIREDVLTWVAENPVLNPIITTFTLTGLRPQELIALKWENVNLENRIISVKKALKRTVSFDDYGNVIGRGVAIGTTKTRKGVRTFVVGSKVTDTLAVWKQYCIDNDIKSEFVFPSVKTGAMRTYTGLRSMLNRFIKRHGLQDEGITLYTFRHTFATILLEQRENPKIVAELMGHEDASTTLDFYSHVVSGEVYAQTAQTLDNVWDNLTQKKSPTNPCPDSSD